MRECGEPIGLVLTRRCALPVKWDILAQGGGPKGTLGRIAARCDMHLGIRLLEWYDLGPPTTPAQYAAECAPWSVQVRPYDATFVDPDEADDDDYSESMAKEDRRQSATDDDDEETEFAAQAEWQKTWDHANRP